MNLIHKHLCPVCSNTLEHIYNDDSTCHTCQNGCYALYDYGSIQDIVVMVLFGKVVFSIYHDDNQQETFIYNKAGKMIFKVDYLIPIDFKDMPKFFNKIKTYLVFS
jgi:hypothetical protein